MRQKEEKAWQNRWAKTTSRDAIKVLLTEGPVHGGTKLRSGSSNGYWQSLFKYRRQKSSCPQVYRIRGADQVRRRGLHLRPPMVTLPRRWPIPFEGARHREYIPEARENPMAALNGLWNKWDLSWQSSSPWKSCYNLLTCRGI